MNDDKKKKTKKHKRVRVRPTSCDINQTLRRGLQSTGVNVVIKRQKTFYDIEKKRSTDEKFLRSTDKLHISTKTRLIEEECAKKKQPRPWEHMTVAYQLSDIIYVYMEQIIFLYYYDNKRIFIL